MRHRGGRGKRTGDFLRNYSWLKNRVGGGLARTGRRSPGLFFSVRGEAGDEPRKKEPMLEECSPFQKGGRATFSSPGGEANLNGRGKKK